MQKGPAPDARVRERANALSSYNATDTAGEDPAHDEDADLFWDLADGDLGDLDRGDARAQEWLAMRAVFEQYISISYDGDDPPGASDGGGLAAWAQPVSVSGADDNDVTWACNPLAQMGGSPAREGVSADDQPEAQRSVWSDWNWVRKGCGVGIPTPPPLPTASARGGERALSSAGDAAFGTSPSRPASDSSMSTLRRRKMPCSPFIAQRVLEISKLLGR